MERSRVVKGLVMGALALTLGSSAWAQTSNRSRGRHHGNSYPPPRVIQRPPELLHPNSLGLIEQGFQLMRQSSPNPNKFMNGRWNPRYEVVTPPVIQGGGGGYYYPPVYGTPYGYGAGYGYPQYGYPQYGYGNGPVVQREVIIYQNGVGQPTPQVQQALPVEPAQPQAPAPSTRKPAGEDFYLRGNGETESITTALDDIRKSWLNGDFERLKARFPAEGKLKVFLKGEFKYSAEAKDFVGMVKDAMTRIDTMAFEFDRPKAAEGGRVFVSGKHTFLDDKKQKQTTHISYGLQQIGGKWKIVEAGSSSEPVANHAE